MWQLYRKTVTVCSMYISDTSSFDRIRKQIDGILQKEPLCLGKGRSCVDQIYNLEDNIGAFERNNTFVNCGV